MKSRIAAKRRWFTARNYARVAYRTRFAALERSISEAMLSDRPARDTQEVLKRYMLGVFRETVGRPVVRSIVREMVRCDPLGVTVGFGRSTNKPR